MNVNSLCLCVTNVNAEETMVKAVQGKSVGSEFLGLCPEKWHLSSDYQFYHLADFRENLLQHSLYLLLPSIVLYAGFSPVTPTFVRITPPCLPLIFRLSRYRLMALHLGQLF